MVMEKENKYNTDESHDPTTEESFEGGRFFFPDAFEPNSETGTFSNQHSFATVMLNGTAPTILFHGGEFASLAETKIQDIFPVSFPFGTGGMNEKRKNGVSQLECLKHYMRLSLPQTHRPDFILVVCSIYHCIKSFTSGFIMYQSMLQGKTLAEQVANITADDVAAASKRAHLQQPPDYSNAAFKYLQTVSTACKPMGHSKEVAQDARKN